MDIQNKKLLVIGSAKSGIGASKLAQNLGAIVTLFDEKKIECLNETQILQLKNLETEGLTLLLGKNPNLNDYDLIVVSPGVPLDIPLVQEAFRLKKQIIGEFEFASQYCKAPILAITGTNGKTTTTSLVGNIVAAAYPQTYVVGNIGQAFSEEVNKISAESVVVAEVSSFQLEMNQTFHPKVSAILNITPDHLNRHKTMENYCQAKYHIFKLQDSEDFTILNANDPYFEEEEKLLTSQCIAFKVDGPVKRGAYCEAGQIYENIFSATPQHVCAVADLKILGKHNIENVLAAVAMTRAFNIPLEIVKKEVQAFMGVAHRIEYVATKKGVNFYNDSKATNVDAAIRGLVAMPSNVRLIGGGMDKKTSFKEWIAYFPNKVSKLYLIGETAEQIIEECKGIGFTEIEKFKSLEEATQKAYEDAQSGECILLSPACASWDMFESYEQRGEIFKEVVSQLEG